MAEPTTNEQPGRFYGRHTDWEKQSRPSMGFRSLPVETVGTSEGQASMYFGQEMHDDPEFEQHLRGLAGEEGVAVLGVVPANEGSVDIAAELHGINEPEYPSDEGMNPNIEHGRGGFGMPEFTGSYGFPTTTTMRTDLWRDLVFFTSTALTSDRPGYVRQSEWDQEAEGSEPFRSRVGPEQKVTRKFFRALVSHYRTANAWRNQIRRNIERDSDRAQEAGKRGYAMPKSLMQDQVAIEKLAAALKRAIDYHSPAILGRKPSTKLEEHHEHRGEDWRVKAREEGQR